MPVSFHSKTDPNAPAAVPGKVNLAFKADSAPKSSAVDVTYSVFSGTGVRLTNAAANNKPVTTKSTGTEVSHAVGLALNGMPLSKDVTIRGKVTEKGAFRFNCDWRVAVKLAAAKTPTAESALLADVGVASLGGGGLRAPRARRRSGEKASRTKTWYRKRGPKRAGRRHS